MHPRRRKTDQEHGHDAGDCPGGCDDLDIIDDRLDRGAVRMDALETQITAIRTDVEEVLDILRLGKSFFRLAGYVGSFVKWSVAIGAPVVAFYWTLKGGK
jgi:hypothetical protein